MPPKMMRSKTAKAAKIKSNRQPSMFESTPKESVKNSTNLLEDSPGTNTEVTFKIRPRISFVVSCSKHTTTKKGFIGSSHFNGIGEFHNIEAARQTADLLMDANKRHKDCKLVFESPDSWFEQQLAAFKAQQESAASVDDKPKKSKAIAKPAADEETLVKNAKHLRKLLLVKKGKKKKRKRV